MRKALVFLLAIVSSISIIAQSGPGGVGTNSTNIIWLDASTLSLSNGADVTSWNDISGNGFSFGASTDAGSSFPDFLTDGGAGFPALDFDDSNEERLIINPFNSMPSTTISTIMVFATANNSEGIISYSAVGNGGGNNEYLFFDANSIRTYVGDANNAGGSFNDGVSTYNIFVSTWQSAGGNLTHYKNGTSVNTATIATGDAMVNGGSLAIGGEQDSDDGGYAANQDFGGRIAEVIMFNTLISSAEQVVIQNYLSTKYGIAITNDFFTFSTSTQNVIGIGRDGTSNHMTSTGSGGGLFISGTTGTGTTVFDANEWLFAAHNGSASDEVTLLDVPVGTRKRLERVWAIDETTTDGFDATLTFNIDDLGLVGASNFALFKRLGTSGTFSVVSTGTLVGSEVSFSVSDADLEDAYFTLGFDFPDVFPGSIGTDLSFWLKADDDVATSGSAVTSWADQSGNANNPSQGTGSNQPILNGLGVNFNPAIEFDGTDDILTAADGFYSNEYFIVFEPDANISSSSTAQYPIGFGASGGLALGDESVGNPPNELITHESSTGVGVTYEDAAGTLSDVNIISLSDNDTDHFIYLNGTNLGTTTTSVVDNSDAAFAVGDITAATSPFAGKITEIISYTSSQIPSNRQRITSYLAIKYGVTLRHDYLSSSGTEVFDVDGGTNTGYLNDIVALSSDVATDLVQRVSKSRNDSLVIALEDDFSSSNASRSTTLADNSFFFASSNGANFTTTSSSGNVLLDRVWKVNESGTVGTVFLGLPTSLYEFDSLLVSTDPTFATGVTRVAVSTSGSYNSVSYDFTDGEYFTFTVTQAFSADNGDFLLWLKADQGVSTSGSNVTLWADQTPNGNDANNDDTEFDEELELATQDEDPVELANNSYNFNPSITFNNDDRPLSGSYTTTGGFNFFIVGTDGVPGVQPDSWFDSYQDNTTGGSGNNRTWFFENRYASNTLFADNDSTADNSKAIYSIVHPEGNTANIYENGEAFELSYPTNGTNDNDAGLYHYVIGDDATGGNEFTGSIAEFLVFQGTLSDTERQRIESYLAIKYAITLNSDYVDQTDNILFDVTNSSINDRFENYIAVLGRNDLYGLDQKVARADSGNLVISIAQDFEGSNQSRGTSLSDGQYFFTSANTGSVASDSSYRSFSGNRLGRKWKVTETNNPGAVYVAISDTVAANFNVLVVSTDSTFSSGITEVPLNQSGGFYFVQRDFTSGEYFTFANSVSPGGVGEGLQVWLKADSELTVAGWGDQSGNDNDATSPENDPTIVASGMNFNPALQFSTAGDRMQGALVTNTDSLSFLVVAEDRSGASSGGVLIEFDATTDLTLNDGSYAGLSFTSPTNIIKDTAQLISVVHPEGTGPATIYQNGASFETGAVSAAEATTYNYAIGDNVASANGFDGLISEVIVYDESLTDTEREMLESYLAVKYALPIAHDVTASDGSTVLDATASVGYLNGLFGLGYDVRTQLDQKVGKSPYDSLRMATTDDFATANTSRTTVFNDLQYSLITNDGGAYTITADYKAETNVRLERVWEVHELNNPGTIVLALPNTGVFTSLNTILVSPDPTFATGVTEQSLSVSGSNRVISIDLTDGQYFTFTTSAPQSSIWYSYLSGNWSDPANWTLDGAISPLYLNPSNEIPSEGDTVVIQSGRTITSDFNGVLVERVEINGNLDLANTGGHDFTYLLGQGTMRLSGASGVDNYPAGIDTLFYSATEGGTVEYYGSGLTLDSKRNYNNLIINLDDAVNEVEQTGDSIWVNGNMTITRGTYQFGSNSIADDEVAEVRGNVLVEANGGIEVGSSNSRHELNLYGDFTNQGMVEFTNRTSADFNNEATDGIVDVNFVSPNQDQNVDLQNTTIFYRMEINKGVDETYRVSLAADDPSHFSLFGFSDQGHGSTAQLTTNDNALGLIYGTVEVGNNIQINELADNGNYNVSEGAALEINGGSVIGSRWIVTYGSLIMNAGSLNLGIGTVLRNSGFWEIHGGQIDMGHFRTSALGAGNDGSWTQTGGVVNLTGSGSQGDYYTFSLTYETCSFTMTGGELNISVTNSAPTGYKGIFLNAATENATVTGGTITLDQAHTETDSLLITSTVPFYNLTLRQSVANANPNAYFFVSGGNSGGGAPDGVTLGGNPLIVNNDLTIDNADGNTTTVDFDGNDVEVTGNLVIQNGAVTDFTDMTLRMNGVGSSSFDIQLASTLVLDSLEINKNDGVNVNIINGQSTAIQVDNYFNLASGNFNLDTYDVTVNGAMNLGDTIGTATSTGQIYMNGSSTQSITNAGAGAIYDLEIDNTNGVSLTGDLGIIENFILDGGVFDIGTNKLSLNQEVTTNGVFGSTLMVQTAGNASDGGIEYYFDGATADPAGILYPLGTNANATVRYTPATLDLSGISDDGYVQIRTSDTELQTVDISALANNMLTYYWRISHNGFGTLPTVSSVVFSADDSDDPDAGATPAGLPINFVPGKVLDGSPFTRSQENTSDISGLDITFNDSGAGFTLENANYTSGDGTTTLFSGSPTIYYTTIVADRQVWSDEEVWTLVDDAIGADDGNTGVPGPGDVAVLKNYGNGSDDHWVTINTDITVAQLIFDNSLGGWSPRAIVTDRDANLDLGPISGTGQFQLFLDATNTPAFTGTSDLGDFASQTNSQFNFRLADAGVALMPANITEYPQVRIEAGNGDGDDDVRILATSVPITINRFLQLDRSPRFRINHDVTVVDDVRVTWQLNRTTIELGDDRQVTFDIGGDLLMRDGAGDDAARILVKNDNLNGYEHTIRVRGDIEFEAGLAATSTFDLYNGTSPNNNAILELSGEGDFSLTNNAPGVLTPDLYRVVMNAGTDTTYTFTFNDTFTLNGDNTTDPQALELQNGKLILNDPTINIELANGSDFTIPATAGLEVTQGTITSTNANVILDGLLRMNGGTATLASTDIEYSSSGNALLDITSGTLNVGGQVRRTLTSSNGVLKYRQSGGDVDVATEGAGSNTRAAFEVLNPGSEFILTGGTFNVERGVTGDANLSVELDPATFDVTGSTITIFENLGANYGSNFFNISSTVDLNNVTIANSINLPDVRLFNQNLAVNDLTINSNQTLLTNGFNLSLNGDFTNSGTYTNTSSETIIAGSGAQSISGAGTFTIFDLRKNGSGTTTSSVSLDIDHDLILTSGTLDMGANAINLNNDAFIQSTLTNTGGNGLVFNGTTNQELNGLTNTTVDLGTVTINNSNGVDIPDGNGYDFNITQELRLDGGVFNIGGSLVTMQAGAPITEVSTFGVNNMVQTNSSFTDNGLRIDFFTVAVDTTVFFPVGELKYTPVQFELNSGTTNGSIRVRPANERHPTIVDDAEPGTVADPEIDDTQNVLQYHWIVVAQTLTNANGTATFFYDHDDITNTQTDTTNFISARLLANDVNWDKFAPTLFLGASQTFQVPLNTFTANEITGDYTAGAGSSDGVNADIEGAIPNQLAQYETSFAGAGNYSVAANWNTITGPAVTDGIGPVGAQIIIRSGDDLTLNLDNIRLYATEIEAGAILRVPAGTTGVRLGTVTGSGTIVLEDNELLPTGEYTNFFQCSGGALQYSGTTSYNVLSGISQVRKVVLDGSGSRTLPNNLLTICDTLEINGPTVVLNSGLTYAIGDSDTDLFDIQAGVVTISNGSVVNLNGDFDMSGGSLTGSAGTNLNVTDDLSFSSGTLNWNGTDVTLNGSTSQLIDGAFTGTASFDDLTVNNSGAGITINSGDVVVTGVLTCTDGLINTTSSETLTLTSTGSWTDASVNSYITGPMTKESIVATSTFEFPVGKPTRYAPVSVVNVGAGNDDWTAEYFTSTGATYLNTSFDTEDPGSGFNALIRVEGTDRWEVTSAGSNTAQVRATYGPHNAFDNTASIRLVWWDDEAALDGDAAQNRWENQGGQVAGTTSAGTVTSENTVFFSTRQFALGYAPETTLPVELLDFTAQASENVVLLSWSTVSELNNDYFEVLHSTNGEEFISIGKVDGSGTTNELIEYALTHSNPVPGDNYYQLRQVDFDGTETLHDIIKVYNDYFKATMDITVYPNPATSENLNLQVSTGDNHTPINVRIIDLNGRVYYQRAFNGSLNLDERVQPALRMIPGIYFMLVQQGDQIKKQKIVIR